MTTPSMIVLAGETPRVMILSQMLRDRQASMMDTCDNPHQVDFDGKD
jgi:hypothetical protein